MMELYLIAVLDNIKFICIILSALTTAILTASLFFLPLLKEDVVIMKTIKILGIIAAVSLLLSIFIPGKTELCAIFGIQI